MLGWSSLISLTSRLKNVLFLWPVICLQEEASNPLPILSGSGDAVTPLESLRLSGLCYQAAAFALDYQPFAWQPFPLFPWPLNDFINK